MRLHPLGAPAAMGSCQASVCPHQTIAGKLFTSVRTFTVKAAVVCFVFLGSEHLAAVCLLSKEFLGSPEGVSSLSVYPTFFVSLLC